MLSGFIEHVDVVIGSGCVSENRVPPSGLGAFDFFVKLALAELLPLLEASCMMWLLSSLT